MKKRSDHKPENAVSYLSNLSVSFSDNYSNLQQFNERKELFVRKTIDLLPLNSHILDLGCGPGIITYALAEKGYQVTGIDGSEEMIRLARSKPMLINNPGFFQMNIPFLPQELDQRFDEVISSSLLEYLDQYHETILLVKELLKVNGIFIASIPNIKSWYRKFEKMIFFLWGRPYYLKFVKNKFSPEEFTTSISTSGFKYLGHEYFAVKGPLFRFLGKYLPKQFVSNMLLCVFLKIP